MTIDTSEQGTEEWKKARLGLFTASRAGDLMLKQKNGKPYATRKNYIMELALERITGLAKEFVVSEAMQNGIDSERTAALAYSFHKNVETEQTGFWHNDFFGASPDDLVGEHGGAEYKNPLPATHNETLKTQEIPGYYYWQVIQNLLVTGRDWWDYVSHCAEFPHNAQLFVKRVNRKDVEEDIQALGREIWQANKEVEEEVNFIKNYKEI
jgi:hypothetical protein